MIGNDLRHFTPKERLKRANAKFDHHGLVPKLRVVGIAAIVSFAAVVGLASPANAVTSPSLCPPETDVSFSNIKTGTIADEIVFGQGGVTLSISESSGTTVTGTVGGSGTFSLSAIIAGAQTQVNASIAYSKTTTVTRGGTWTVPTSVSQGWLADGAQTRHFSWKQFRQNGNCTSTVTGTGTANMPVVAPYIFHS